MRSSRFPAVIAALLVGAVPAGGAWAAPVTSPAGVPARGLEAAAGATPTRLEPATLSRPPARGRAAFAAFVAEAGTGWRGLWDAATGAPIRLFGRGLPAPGSTADAARAAAHARGVLSRHAALLAPGIDPDDLELVLGELSRGLRTVAFVQRARIGAGVAVPVVGGQVSFRYKADRLIVIASELVPEAANATAPRLDAAGAAEAALRWLRVAHPGAVQSGAPELVVVPLVDARGARATSAFRVPIEAGRIPLLAYVDAGSGAPVAIDTLVRFAEANVRYDVPVRAPQHARKHLAASRASVMVLGEPAHTSASGVLSWWGADPIEVELFASGSGVAVHNGAGPSVSTSFVAVDGATLDWSLAEDETGDAQLSAFVHTGIVKARAAELVPGLSLFDKSMPVYVNGPEPQYACNAYWNGTSMNFFRSAGECNNTARVADIVYHEFGHALHQHARLGGVGKLDAALGEGVSDYLSASMTGDPTIGPGFLLGGASLRRIDVLRRWPQDVHWDPHETGLIFAGAMWDLRSRLVAALGLLEGAEHADRLYIAALRRASSIVSTYAEILAEDDDDGDLANGTPHVCAINAAFSLRGLTPYLNAAGLRVEHEALSVLTPGSGAHPLRVKATVDFPQCEGESLQQVRVRWRNQSTHGAVLTLEQEGDEFTGAVPEQYDGAALRYVIDASGSGSERTFPTNGADPEYRGFVGETRVLHCSGFEDGAGGWSFGTTKGVPGQFDVGPPGGLGGDPPLAFAGSNVLGTVLAGDGRYASSTTSFAEGPVVDLGGAKRVRLQLRRWLTVEDGAFDRARILVNGQEVWRNAASSQNDGTLGHEDAEWRFEDIDLATLVAQGASTVQVRLELRSDSSVQRGGWNVDDVCLVEWIPAPDSPLGEEPGPGVPDGAGPSLVASGGCASSGRSGSGGGPLGLVALAGLALLRRAVRARG